MARSALLYLTTIRDLDLGLGISFADYLRSPVVDELSNGPWKSMERDEDGDVWYEPLGDFVFHSATSSQAIVAIMKR